MFKKTILTLTVCLLSSTAIAAGKFYLGVNTDMDSWTWRVNNGNVGSTLTAKALGVGVFAGYNWLIKEKYSLDAELLYSHMGKDPSSRTELLNPGTGTRGRIKATYTYGLAVLPGFKLADDITLFARIGVVRTRFTYTELPLVPPLVTITNSDGETLTGQQAGFGVKLGLNKNFNFRAEYIYTGYSSYHSFSSRIRPRNNALSFSILYQFA